MSTNETKKEKKSWNEDKRTIDWKRKGMKKFVSEFLHKNLIYFAIFLLMFILLHLTPWLQLNKKKFLWDFPCFCNFIRFFPSSPLSAAILKRWKLYMQVVYCRLNAFIECWTAECLSLDSYWRRRCRCHRWEKEKGICMQMAKNVKIVIQGKEIHSAISEWRHPAEAAGSCYWMWIWWGFIVGCWKFQLEI